MATHIGCSAGALRALRCRWFLVILSYISIGGCSAPEWGTLKPHFTTMSAPGKVEWTIVLSSHLFSVSGPRNSSSLWAVGDNGTILHSADGQHWHVQNSDTGSILSSVYASSDGKSVWTVGAEGIILHTTDGEHWRTQNSGTDEWLDSVFGAGKGESLWAVGRAGTILHTNDGERWEAQNSGTNALLPFNVWIE